MLGFTEIMEDNLSDDQVCQMICSESLLSETVDVSLPDSECNALHFQKPHPNILKKREIPLQGPIKNLPFSPSRFLNRASDACKSKAVIAQDDILCESATEDSGIEISTCDNEGQFPNLITSTPIAKRQERVSLVNPFDVDSRLGESCISAAPDSLFEEKNASITPERVAFRTPLIRRFLNESGPRTPTPFKFDGHSFSIKVGEGKSTVVIDSSSSKKSSKKKFRFGSQGIHDWPSKRKARKALNMDGSYQDTDAYPNTCKRPVESLRPFLKRTQSQRFFGFRNGNFVPKHLAGSVMKPSCLVGGSYQYNQANTATSHFSSTSTHPARQNFALPFSFKCSENNKYIADPAYSVQMNERLVHIACGYSEDQKMMTMAAKKYLRTYKNNHSSDSLKIIPMNRRLGRHSLN